MRGFEGVLVAGIEILDGGLLQPGWVCFFLFLGVGGFIRLGRVLLSPERGGREDMELRIILGGSLSLLPHHSLPLSGPEMGLLAGHFDFS